MRIRLVIALTVSSLPAWAQSASSQAPVPVTITPIAPTAAPAPQGPVPVSVRPIAPAPSQAPVTQPAPAAAARPKPPPFPPPVVGPVLQDTRFTSGVVLSADANAHVFHVNTAAGDLACKVIETSRIIGTDGQPAQFASIVTGTALRVYFQTGKGALVQEVDLIPTR